MEYEGNDQFTCWSTFHARQFAHLRGSYKENYPNPLYINKTNVFTEFHDDWARNVTSSVFTSFLSPTDETRGDLVCAPCVSQSVSQSVCPSHVVQQTGTIFELNSCI
ncbi:hypothetical protein DPMN_017662 [Dreissena polymorpha]|uniref:Uncharacterized protein n=1 Tax=Dreissena polymorpha TaxID=45954 RepID=A0A9D4NFN5_DREPO|nr:hypothetical protein DPMN_017662 [Dreissena polymorpha]